MALIFRKDDAARTAEKIYVLEATEADYWVEKWGRT
jgi:hypothetical protein